MRRNPGRQTLSYSMYTLDDYNHFSKVTVYFGGRSLLSMLIKKKRMSLLSSNFIFVESHMLVFICSL